MARKILKENPQTKDVCAYFEHLSDSTLGGLVGLANMWEMHDTQTFIDMEDAILNIMACFLKRKIIFTPLFDSAKWDVAAAIPKVFQEQFNDTYHIFGIRANLLSLYVSTIPVVQSIPEIDLSLAIENPTSYCLPYYRLCEK